MVLKQGITSIRYCFGIRREAAMFGQCSTARIAEKRTYTVGEVAGILGIGRTTAYKLIHSGQFTFIKVGSAIRVSKASFDEWLDKQS